MADHPCFHRYIVLQNGKDRLKKTEPNYTHTAAAHGAMTLNCLLLNSSCGVVVKILVCLSKFRNQLVAENFTQDALTHQ